MSVWIRRTTLPRPPETGSYRHTTILPNSCAWGSPTVAPRAAFTIDAGASAQVGSEFLVFPPEPGLPVPLLPQPASTPTMTNAGTTVHIRVLIGRHIRGTVRWQRPSDRLWTDSPGSSGTLGNDQGAVSPGDPRV